MSAAFGTINRRRPLDIIKSIVDEDEPRLAQTNAVPSEWHIC